MSERDIYDPRLVRIGELLVQKRKALGTNYRSRENFIHQRSREVFDGVPWISVRHLSSLESGKNWISIEMLIQHAYALEMDPVELFRELLQAYQE